MQRLLLFLVFMTLGSGLVFLVGVEKPTTEEVVSSLPPVNRLTIRGILFQEFNVNALRLWVDAEKGEVNEQTGISFLENIRFRGFDPAQPEALYSFRGRAAIARVDRKTGVVTLTGGVNLESSDGALIQTTQIDYDDKKGILTAPGKVLVKTGESSQEGSSMRYDVHDRKIILTKPVFYQ